MTFIRILFISAICLSITIICNGQQSKNITIAIEPYKRLTYDAFFKQLVLYSPDCHVEQLEGFNFEWGVRYRLKVKEIHLFNTPEDASSINYELKKVISTESVDKDFTFKLRLERDFYLGPGEQVNNFNFINDSTFSYFNEIEVEIPTKFKSEFNKIIEENISMNGEFVFLNSKRVRLIGISKH